MLQGPEEHPVDEQIRRLLLWHCVMVLHKDDVKLTMGLRNSRKVLVFLLLSSVVLPPATFLVFLQYIHHSPGNSKRGFGIDCAILSCQVYISQILVASALGSVVDLVGTVRVIPMVASVGSFLGFLTATFLVIYPEVNEEPKEEQKGLGPPETAEGSGAGAEKPTVLKLTRKGAAAAEPEGESAV